MNHTEYCNFMFCLFCLLSLPLIIASFSHMLYFLCAISSFPKIPRNHKLVLRVIKFRMSVTQYVISFWNTVPFPRHMLVPFSDGLLGPVWECKMARPRSLFIFKSSLCGGWMPLRWRTQRSAKALLSQDFIHSLFFRKAELQGSIP